MSPTEALRWLDGISGRGWRLSLDRIEATLERLGRPQDAFAAVHVSGTNGKGSCSAFVEAGLMAAGVPSGRFTSPHLVSVEERIRVNGVQLSTSSFANVLTAVRDHTEPALEISYFEAVTAAAFLAFAEAGVKVAAVEVGLGGRLDATRTCKPAVCVLTNVGLDHQNILGESIPEIAAEKVAICKESVPVVSAFAGPALTVLQDHCEAVSAPLLRVPQELSMTATGERWRYRGPSWDIPDLVLGLLGDHQAVNAACAIGALEQLHTQGVKLPISAVRDGVRDVDWPGRFQEISLAKGRTLLLDCAHNAPGAAALAATLAQRRQGMKFHLLFGALEGKDVDACLGALRPHLRAVTVVPIEAGPRTRDPGELCATVRRSLPEVRVDLSPTVAAAIDAVPSGIPILATGSVYLIGEILRTHRSSDGSASGSRWLDNAKLPSP